MPGNIKLRSEKLIKQPGVHNHIFTAAIARLRCTAVDDKKKPNTMCWDAEVN